MSRRTDLYLRALRDHWADCLVTLPALIEQRADPSLHFWFANLEGVRAALFPRLSQAHAAWVAGDGGAGLRTAVAHGAEHWGRACEEALALYRVAGADMAARVDAYVTSPDRVLE